MKPIKDAVRLTAVVIGGIYSAIFFFAHSTLASWIKTPLSLLPIVISTGVVVYDKWLWKLPGVVKIHSRPRVYGLWAATITPSKDSHIPADGNRGPIDAYALIEQTYWTVDVSMMTAESTSRSQSAKFIKHGASDSQDLRFMYENDPKVAVRDRSNRHVGQCQIYIPAGGATSLEATYFTDRLTRGDISLRFLTTNVRAWSYTSASEEFPHPTGELQSE